MTVGAVIVPADGAEALADAAGRVAVRRIVDAAWAGGALPIVVVADDADGAIARALAGSPAVLVPPERAAWRGAWLTGTRAAVAAVAGTSAVLLWPGRMTWIDPETVTSLIEAHGRAVRLAVRPVRAGTPGWPLLLPTELALDHLAGASLDSDGGSDDAADARGAEPDGIEWASLELGDPGSVLGAEVPLAELPDYAGPPEPVGGTPPEWGAAAAEMPDSESAAAEVPDPEARADPAS